MEQKKKDAYADMLLNLKPYNEKADDQETGKTWSLNTQKPVICFAAVLSHDNAQHLEGDVGTGGATTT